MSVLEVSQIQKKYESVAAVKGIDFSIQKAEIVALLGANGAGKSTTIKMLTGLIKPTSGDISLFSTSYSKKANEIKKRFGFVPEESAMYEDIGIFDYLYFFASVYGVDKRTAKVRAESLLKRLDLQVGNRQIGKLSKGMKRKVLIARSLIHDPDLLIYDEPASGLDPKTAHFILDFMKELKSQGKTILFSSHHLSHVEQIADRVLIMHKGNLITDKPLDSLVHDTTTYRVILKDKVLTTQSLDELKDMLTKHKVIRVEQEHVNLEDVFLRLTK